MPLQWTIPVTSINYLSSSGSGRASVSWKKNGSNFLWPGYCGTKEIEDSIKGDEVSIKNCRGLSLKEILNVREASDLIDKGHSWSVAIKCSIVPVWKWITQKTFIRVHLLWQWMIGLGCSSKLLVLCRNGNGSNFFQRSKVLMSFQESDDQVLSQFTVDIEHGILLYRRYCTMVAYGKIYFEA